MGVPTVNCQSTDAAVAGNTCGLSAEAIDTGLGDWVPLLNFRPPDSIKKSNVARFMADRALLIEGTYSPFPYAPYGYQPIEEGSGSCNVDMYVVDILEPPATLDGEPFTAQALQSKFRQLLPRLLDPSICYLQFLEASDATKWASGTPLGTAGRFYMKGLIADRKFSADVTAPDACVVCTDYSSEHWIFSTIQVPNLNLAFNGIHPVNGNRQFGIGVRKAGDVWSDVYLGRIPRREKDTLFWYTRGVDRCASTPQFSTMETDVFQGGHQCWLGLQRNFANYLMSIGAHVEYVGFWASDRHSWDAYVAHPRNKLWKSPPK